MPVPQTSSTSSWRHDEVRTAGRENLDELHVSRYDAKEDAGAIDEVARLQRLGLDEHSVVVDLGAGTGQFSLAVADRCSRVVAVDVSPVMLERLRRKVADSAAKNIDVVEAGFLTYEHRGSRPHVVYSRYALHHLPDFWKVIALQRAYDMLRPEGVLVLSDVVYDFDPSLAGAGIEAWCATGAEQVDVAQQWSRAELEEHVRDEHSTFTWLLELMLERVGFRVEEVDRSADGIFARYVCRRPSADE